MKKAAPLIAGLLLIACAPTSVRKEPIADAQSSQVMDITDGQTIRLDPTIVRKTIGGKEAQMYGYNGQIPGPMLRVRQGSTFTVEVKNNIDIPTSVHWHGIRLANAFDGAVDVTQEAIEPGGTFTYTVTVPDEGIFWYHPHVREDMQQDLGLYGLIHVLPETEHAYADVGQTETVILDDILIGKNGKPVGYDDEVTFALMGRFGNLALVNGEEPRPVEVGLGSIVRFVFLNASNTRTYRIVQPEGSMMKIVGGDAGRNEKEVFADVYTLSPSERVTVDMFFWDEGVSSGGPGFRTVPVVEAGPTADPVAVYSASIIGGVVGEDQRPGFERLRGYGDVAASIDAYRSFFDTPVDKTLRLTVNWKGMMASAGSPRVGGMNHGGMNHGSTAEKGSIEWEDSMPMMNAMSDSDNTQWKVIDEETGDANMDIDWTFKKGDVVKIRVVNEMESDHPMQHPIHLHGQRFLVLSVDGKTPETLGWKDTVLVPTGSTVDILVPMENPGDWMVHCHIAEHLSNGMMGLFTVE